MSVNNNDISTLRDARLFAATYLKSIAHILEKTADVTMMLEIDIPTIKYLNEICHDSELNKDCLLGLIKELELRKTTEQLIKDAFPDEEDSLEEDDE